MTEISKLREDAYRYAVKNAFLHKGKADLKAIIGKVKALDKALDLKKAMPALQEVVREVNNKSLEEIEAEYREFEGGYELKPKEKELGLEKLGWAEKEKVVTRYAPNPNGPFHLGNARAAYMSWAYAREYNGKFIMRFEDTDPKVKKPIKDAEKIFGEDMDWLGLDVDEIYFASDRLELYYKYMKKLLEMNKAYVCECSKENWRTLISEGEACPCRERKKEEQLKKFEEMKSNKLKEGQAVLRIKTELNHPDPSIRDWWIARIVDNPEHERIGSKYNVWPSYMFQSAVDDHEMGVTLIIRGQEHSQNKTKQEFLYRYFGWTYPHCFHTGRIKLEKIILSKSRIMDGIEKGKFIGWDDPRLGTIRALRRRGFDARALKEILMEIGVKSNDATISMAKLIDANKKFIEAEAERATFFDDPVVLNVGYTKAVTVEKDGREYQVKEGNQDFLVSKKELSRFKKGDIIRLRSAFNARLIESNELMASAEFVGTQKIEKNILWWIMDGTDVEIMMSDASTKLGTTECFVREKKVNDRLFFEKFGFVRVDSKEGKRIKLWFTHN